MPLLLLLLSCLSARADQAKEVFSKVRPQVFQVKAAMDAISPKASYGSGFIVSNNGLIITNYHVISSVIMEEKGYLPFVDIGKEWVPAQIVDVDVVHDLALLKIDRSFTSFLRFREGEAPQGAKIYSFGLPEDLNMSIVEGTYNGVISQGPYRQIHVTSPINAGMSGGPATDSKGNVIGINVSTFTDSHNISFLVPAKYAEALLRRASSSQLQKKPQEILDRILEQLKEAQLELSKELTEKEKPSFDFSNWNLNKTSEVLKCWSSNKDDEKKRYKSLEHKCFIDHSAYLKDNYLTGTFSITYRTVKKNTVSKLQFYHLINRIYNGGDRYDEVFFSSFNYSDTFVTRYDCGERLLKNINGIPIKFNYCLRGYVKLPGIYDIYFKGTTLTRQDEELIFYAQANGFEPTQIQTFVKRMIDSINHKGAKSL